MSQETLLVIFIGMTALAWVAIAAIVVAVGWQVYKLVIEVRAGVDRLHKAGESAAAEVARMHEKFVSQVGVVRSLIEVALGAFASKLASTRRKSKKASVSESEAE